MKPTVQEDIEDDLHAEEENKIINEVREHVSDIIELQCEQLAIYAGVQNMVS